MPTTLDFSKIRAHLDGIAEGFAGQVAKVGWFPAATYEDGTPVAYIATIQEYGAPERGIPPRPFLKPTIDAQKANWVRLMGQGVKAVGAGKYTAEQVLEGVGLQAVGDIQKTIGSITSPPLSQVTLLLRKWRREGRTITGKTVGEAAAAVAAGADTSGVNADPLRDTGLLLASLSNTVGPAE